MANRVDLRSASSTESAERRASKASNRVRRHLLDVVALLRRWAESGSSRTAVVTWGVLQGSVFLGPADALLAPLGLSDPRKVFSLAVCAIVGSILGGLIAFGLGAFAFDGFALPLLDVIGVGPQDLASTQALFAERGWMVVLLSWVMPVPTKVVCMAAGAFGMPFAQFSLALLGARTSRTFVVAMLLRLAGTRFVTGIERRLGRPIATLR